MSLQEQIVDSLNDIGFAPAIESADDLALLLDASKLVEFSRLVSFLATQLIRLINIDECVSAIESVSDESTFCLETCSLLKQLGCPYMCLIEGPMSERFSSRQSKLKLLQYLIGELQSELIRNANRPQSEQRPVTQSSKNSPNETEEAKALKSMLIALGFTKPPDSVTAAQIWTRVNSKCTELLAVLPAGHLGRPLLSGTALTDKQWRELMHINEMLSADFQMRRELLLTRLDVTVQSFKWADRLKARNTEITALYQQRRKELSVKQQVRLYSVLAARDDLCRQEKTCSTKTMTHSALHKIIIPKVPDRGGRTCELEPPPPEMPQFAKRNNSAQPQHQRGPRGGHAGGNNKHHLNKDAWCNEPVNSHSGGQRSQSDFERFSNNEYSGGRGSSNSNSRHSRGGGGGGGRGGRGGRGGY